MDNIDNILLLIILVLFIYLVTRIFKRKTTKGSPRITKRYVGPFIHNDPFDDANDEFIHRHVEGTKHNRSSEKVYSAEEIDNYRDVFVGFRDATFQQPVDIDPVDKINAMYNQDGQFVVPEGKPIYQVYNELTK